jgi:hypothetical protein
MKETDARVDYQSHQMLLYVEKSDGSYGPLQTGSYMSKNYIDDFWEKRKRTEDEAFEKLTNSIISPVGYYMLLLDMTPSDVARRAGISLRKVKKHALPRYFPAIKLSCIKRYAEVFGIPVAALFSLVVPSARRAAVSYKKTRNPFVAIFELSEVQEK